MIYDHIKNIGLYKGLTPAISSWSSRRMPTSPAWLPAASALL